LYGAYPHERQKSLAPLKPVLELKSQIICLKNLSPHSTIGYGGTFTTRLESVIAVLPIGYADGYPRLVSNRGHVLVRGRAAPIVGRISMDLMTVDVTDVPGISLGDEAVLIGQDGPSEIRVEQVAAWADTISYEILCGLTSRVPRIYSGS
jgi:alanine racemase